MTWQSQRFALMICDWDRDPVPCRLCATFVRPAFFWGKGKGCSLALVPSCSRLNPWWVMGWEDEEELGEYWQLWQSAVGSPDDDAWRYYADHSIPRSGGVSLIQILESPEDWLCRRTRLRFEVLGLHIYGNISKDAASCRYLFGGFSWKIKKKTDWLFPGSRIILKLGIFQGHFLLSFLRHRSSKVSGNLLWKKLRLIVYVSLIIIIINCGIFFWGILIFLNILRALNMLI